MCCRLPGVARFAAHVGAGDDLAPPAIAPQVCVVGHVLLTPLLEQQLNHRVAALQHKYEGSRWQGAA